MKKLVSPSVCRYLGFGNALALLLASVIPAQGDDPKISDILKPKPASQSAAKAPSKKAGKQTASRHKSGGQKTTVVVKRTTTVVVKKDPKQAAELARLKKEKAEAEQREAEARRQATAAQNEAETAQKQATADREARQAAEDKTRQLQDSITPSSVNSASKVDEDSMTASQLSDIAYTSLCRNLLASSRRQARKSIAKDSSDADAHAILANALFETYMLTGNPAALNEGKSEASKAFELDHECALALNALAFGGWLRGDNKGATKIIHRAVKIAPKMAYLYILQGCVEADVDDKIVSWQQAVELDPKIAWAHSNMAMVYTEQNQATKAAEELQAQRRHSELSFWLCLGEIALSHKEWDVAGDCFRKAIAIKPDYCAGYAPLALALFAKGDREGAREQADLAQKRGVVHHPVYKMLGME